MRLISGSLALLLATACAPALAAAPAARPAPLSQLVAAVDIPYQEFTLPNGLRVIVHTDRKAPVVAVSIWYHIGSKDEPKGETGFAHLYEHLMFYGSQNAPGNLMERLEGIGATDWNGTTWFDRTNYFETVPTGALDMALFLESDRMGHLLNAVTQERLDAQRGVVQNEKRMGDNNPGGLSSYAELAALFPEGHPYGHETIGSMADLNAASLDQVKGWFRSHYGPNNAVLVLAGDIDVPTARAKVEKWFGAIARGPETVHPQVTVPTLPADVTKLMHDRVAATTVQREWVVPGVNSPDLNKLQLAMSVLGGLGSSRLENTLVRDEKVAVGVSAGVQPFENVSFLSIKATVRPGVDAATVEKRLDQLIAQFLETGPTADELGRAATSVVSGTISGLEQVGGFGGKAVTLAEGAVYSNDPAKYKKDLAEIAAATPADVTAVTRKWLSRPKLKFTLAPGERDPADVAAAAGTDQPTSPAAATPAPKVASAPPPPPTIQPPAIQPVADVPFPAIERATLSNGIRVLFARRATVPVVRVAVSFDAGNAADDKAKLGTEALMLALLDEGTTTRSSLEIAQEQERLGAGIGADASMDNTTVSLYALKPNLGPSLDLLADIVRNPAFKPEEVERLRATQLTAIAAEKTDPNGLALRVLPPVIYGTASPYGVPFSGMGDEAGVKAATRADLAAFHQRWMRPDNARIFVVGDTTLAEVVPQLEQRFGTWKPAATPGGTKQFGPAATAGSSRVILIDRPQSPQSMILAGQVLPREGVQDNIALSAANEALGGSASSRLSLDLREKRNWAYYVGTQVATVRRAMPLFVFAPVQTDQTGPSIAAIRQDMSGYISGGTTPAELKKTVDGLILSLPGSFETSEELLGAIQRIVSLNRPDDYYTKLPGRYRALTTGDLDSAARAAIDPAKLVWIVVGDAKLVRPQLEKLGLPIETMEMK